MITGTQEPKFITQGGTTVLLEYCKYLIHEPEYRNLEQESIINNVIKYTQIGVHWIFQVQLHLYKYGANSAVTTYNNLIGYLGSEVYLYPHKEGYAIKDTSGNDLLFHITEVTPSYLETADFKDVITLTFRSTKLVDMSEMSIPENTIFTRKQDMIFPMTDSSGNIQTYDLTEDAE